MNIRNLLDAKYARRPYPGDEYVIPFGTANVLRKGDELTIVTWGAMTEQSEMAVDETGIAADVIDLRTLMPWDKETVINSVKKTNRCLIVHEDTRMAGFGAEISAVLVKEAFHYLDAPIERLTMPNVPVPYNLGLMHAIMPDAVKIAAKMRELVNY